MAVSAEERATIQLGAAIAGVSMSRFVVDAAMRAAERILCARGSAFTEVCQSSEAEALITLLKQGDDAVAQGKVKPVAAVVKRLRTDRQSKGGGVPMDDDLTDLCKELHRIKHQAEALGIFTNDRELLICPQCGLQEDIQSDGRLMTIEKDSQDFKDTGLRFVDMGDGRFSCPRCQALIDAEFL